MRGELVSIQVGRPRQITWRGRSVRTAIYKEPVPGPVRVGATNLEGDRQADLTVHGGVDKAIYAYPAEHYPFWEAELGEPGLGWGSFGENLTVRGLIESEVWIGDLLGIGSAQLRVTQPRLPCYKLGIRLGRPDIVKRFQRSGRSGFYLAVVAPGSITIGDGVELLERDEGALSVRQVWSLKTTHRDDRALLDRAIALRDLAESWRRDFEERRRKLGDRT